MGICIGSYRFKNKQSSLIKQCSRSCSSGGGGGGGGGVDVVDDDDDKKSWKIDIYDYDEFMQEKKSSKQKWLNQTYLQRSTGGCLLNTLSIE